MRVLTACIATASLAGMAPAQPFQVPWFSIDAGGGTSSGASIELSGTVGQHDAGVPMTGASFELTGGFWAMAPGLSPCPADLNNDGTLNFFDVQMFLGFFANHDLRADFTTDGVLNFFDVQAFLNTYSAGCP